MSASDSDAKASGQRDISADRRTVAVAVVVAFAGIGIGIGVGAAALGAGQAPALVEEAPAHAVLDRDTPACQDFYQHACGGFLASTRVDAAEPSISLVEQRFNANLKEVLDRLLVGGLTSTDPERRRLAFFYRACRTAAIRPAEADDATIRLWLSKVDRVRSRNQLPALMRDMARIGADPFITYSGRPERRDPSRYRGEIHQARLWAEPAVIERAFVSAGRSPAEAAREARAVAALVADLRQASVGRYDFDRSEHALTPVMVASLAPSFGWPAYFAMVGAPADRTVNVTSPDLLRAVERQLRGASLPDLRAYLRWTFLLSMRGELPPPHADAFGDIIPPLRVCSDLATRCRDSTTRALGVEFSRQFATSILGPEARDQATQLAASIRAAAVRSIAPGGWLSAEGRAATAAKLAATDLKIGYPDRWPKTGTFTVIPDRFIDTVIAACRFEQMREWRRAQQRRSRRDWEMKVDPWVGEGMAAARLALSNGYPDAFTNSLIMTAAILMPPRYDARLPLEANYATFGTVFAHELVHVAQTHEFDAEGSMAELWTERDIAASKRAGQCVVHQANAYRPFPNLAMNGQRQFGENVADLGGVRIAYEALRARLGHRIDAARQDGMTPARRFFYAYAQKWCTATTQEHLRQTVASDGHAPPKYRVNGVVANMPEFAAAFGCSASAPMTRPAAQMCQVW